MAIAAAKDVAIMREAITKIAHILIREYSVTITQQGVQAYVKHNQNGELIEINIPAIPDNCSVQFLASIQGFIDHEVAHVLFTDGKVVVESYKKGQAIAQLTNIFEDVMIEGKMRKRFPGSAKNLREMYHIFTEKLIGREIARAEHEAKRNGTTQSELDHLGQLLSVLARAYGGQDHFVTFFNQHKHKLPTTIKALEEMDFEKKILALNTTSDSLALAIEFHEALFGDQEGDSSQDGQGQGKSLKSASPSSSHGSSKKGKSGEKDEDEKESEGDGGSSSGPSSKSDSKDSDEDAGSGDSEGDSGDQDETDDDADEEGKGGSGEDENEADEDEADKGSAGDEDEDEDGEGEDETDGNDSGSSDGDSGDNAAGCDDYEEDNAEETAKQESDPSQTNNNNDPVKSKDIPFKIADVDKALKGGDFDEQIAALLADEAFELSSSAKYTSFTKDFDVEDHEFGKDEIRKRRANVDNLSSKIVSVAEESVGSVKRELMRMIKAKSKVQRIPGQRRGRVKASSLHRLRHNDPRVFEKKSVSKSRNVAISVMMDCSGSMSGTKLFNASCALYSLAQALEGINAKYELIGFTTANGEASSKLHNAMNKEAQDRAAKGLPPMNYSRYHVALHHVIFKPFDKSFSNEIRDTIAWANLDPSFGGGNVDGESVEFGLTRLERQHADGHMMIVLSDGQPTGSINGDRHLKDVVDGAMNRGVKMVGIGINSQAVQHYYPHHVYLNDPKDLGKTIIKEVRDAFLSQS